MKLINYLKKRWYLVLLLLILIGLVLFVILKKRGKTGPVTTGTPEIALYQKVQPGKTTKEQLVTQSGQPLSKSTDGNYEVYDYASKIPLPVQVYLENNTVVFIKEPVKYEEDRFLSDYVDQLGLPTTTVFDPDFGAATIGNVFPSYGILVFAGRNEGRVREIWYFQPTTLEGFRELWGKELVDEYNQGPE